MGDSLFNKGKYNRVFLEMWAQIPIRTPMLKQWAVGSFFSWKYSRRAHRDPQKFIKTIKWEKWWSWWLRMTNVFILCNVLWKVQKSLAANREGSFKYPILQQQLWQCCNFLFLPSSPGLHAVICCNCFSYPYKYM